MVDVPSPLATSPEQDSEQKLLLDCCKFCEAVYSDKNDEKKIADFEIKDFCNWERLSNRAISFTTKSLNLSSLNMEAGPVTVVAFRGTSNPSEICEDLKSYKAVPLYTEENAPATSETADLNALHISQQCKYLLYAGSGFVDAYKDLRGCRKYLSISTDEDYVTTATYTTFIADVCRISKNKCGGRLLVVGHSLGGAMAQLFATEILHNITTCMTTTDITTTTTITASTANQLHIDAQVSFCYPKINLGLVTFGMPRTLANKEQEATLFAAAKAKAAKAKTEAESLEQEKGNEVLTLKNDSNGYYHALAAGASRVRQYVERHTAEDTTNKEDSNCQEKTFTHIRVVNHHDPVPTLPPSGFGFSHKATKVVHFKMDRKGGSWRELTDKKVADDYDGLDGVFQFIKWDPSSHLLSATDNRASYIARLSVKTIPYSYSYKDYFVPCIVLGSALVLTTAVSLYLGNCTGIYDISLLIETEPY